MVKPLIVFNLYTGDHVEVQPLETLTWEHQGQINKIVQDMKVNFFSKYEQLFMIKDKRTLSGFSVVRFLPLKLDKTLPPEQEQIIRQEFSVHELPTNCSPFSLKFVANPNVTQQREESRLSDPV